MLGYITGCLGLIVLTAAITIAHLGFVLTFALLMILIGFIISVFVTLYLFVVSVLHRLRRVGV